MDHPLTNQPAALQDRVATQVALFTNFLPPYRIPMLEALEKRLDGLQIFVSVGMEPNRAWPVDWGRLSVTVQRCMTLHQTWRHPNGFSERIFVQLPYDTLWLLFRRRPKVVVSGELGLRTILAALYRRCMPGSRLLIWATLSEYTEQGRGRLREMLRRWLVHQADAFLVNGESGARYLRRLGVADERLNRLPQTTEVSAYRHLERPSKGDVRRLLYVGQLVERKGLGAFFAALQQWSERHPGKELEVSLAGNGPLREALETASLPPGIRCRFLGNVPFQEVPGLYAQADVLVFPTLADEWGLVVNEAMAAGLPVLGSLYSQAVEELVEDGRNGWTFRPDQPSEILAALERALSVPNDEVERMGQAARERVADLTPERMAERIARAIAQVL